MHEAKPKLTLTSLFKTLSRLWHPSRAEWSHRAKEQKWVLRAAEAAGIYQSENQRKQGSRSPNGVSLLALAWGWRIQTDMAENSHAKLWLKQRDHFSGSHRSFWSLREEKTWKPHWAFIGHPKIATLGLGPCPRAGISKLFHKEPENKYSCFCGPSGCSCNTELCCCNWKAATDNA